VRGEAEPDAFPEGLRGTQSDPRILGVQGVTHAVTRVLERSLRDGQVVGVLGPEGSGELPDRGVRQVDDFIIDQVKPPGREPVASRPCPGPPHPDIDIERLRLLLREAFAAAGGHHDNRAE
jgi:hypothetical protein